MSSHYHQTLDSSLHSVSPPNLSLSVSWQFSHKRPSPLFIGNLLEKFDSMLKPKAETHNPSLLSIFSKQQRTSQQNPVQDVSQLHVAHQLRVLQLMMAKKQTLLDLIHSCIDAFGFTNNSSEPEHSEFLKTLQFEYYLHFWVSVVEHERSLLDVHPKNKHFYITQYLLSRPLRQYLHNSSGTLAKYMMPKPTDNAQDMKSTSIVRCVANLRNMLLGWIDLSKGDMYPTAHRIRRKNVSPKKVAGLDSLMNSDACKVNAAKLYGHVVTVFDVDLSDVEQDLRRFKDFNKERELTMLLTHWHHDAGKLKVLTYLYHVWAINERPKEIKNYVKLVSPIGDEVRVGTIIRRRKAEEWYSLVIILREMYRTILLGDYLTTNTASGFFSPTKKSRVGTRQSNLTNFQKHKRAFVEAFNELRKGLENEEIVDRISTTVQEDNMIDYDDLVSQIKYIVHGSIIELEGLTDEIIVNAGNQGSGDIFL